MTIEEEDEEQKQSSNESESVFESYCESFSNTSGLSNVSEIEDLPVNEIIEPANNDAA